MKSILTGTLATLVLGAAIASSQTPPAQQAPAPPAGGATPPAVQEPAGQRSAPAKPQTSTYKGILKGSAASGWTISPITARSGAANTPGATATAGGDQVTYTVVAAEGGKVDLASMADDCVEISGVLSPEGARATPGASDPAAAAAAAKNRTLTVVTIKEAEGCSK
jgi:hypothetical protein